MAAEDLKLSGVERFFGDEEIIVSKTDLNGRINYCNDVFMRVSGFREDELIGAPHSIIRHPEMPRSIFKFLWETIQGGDECFAYVLNRSKNGDHYWVLAHVTPSYDGAGNAVGYHSNRRTPDRDALEQIVPLYRDILKAERRESNKRAELEAGTACFQQFLARAGMPYEQLIFSLNAA